MQLKTLWSIILKTIGVIMMFKVIEVLLFVLTMGLSFQKIQLTGETATPLAMFLVEACLAFLCLFRTDLVIGWFRLESTIPEKQINVNFEARNVMRLAIAIIGIYSLSNSIPDLFSCFEESRLKSGFLISTALRVMFGIVMVLKNQEIEALISRYQNR